MTISTTSNLDTGAARLGDSRFYGIERFDLKTRYGARCDGSSHPLAGLYSSLAAAQTAFPAAGLVSANWSAMEVDTAAWLQAEYETRTGSGGIIGLADNAVMTLSQQLWLQDASRVAFHGGRGTRLITEGTGTTPAVRVSNAWGGELGPAQAVPLRDLGLMAFKGGRSSFGGSQAGSASPGYASSATMSAGSVGGYRTGATAILIDDGGVAGQHSTNFVFERVRWCNYDESVRWGDNTFAATLRDCFGEGNNKGLSWSQSTGLNSMEKMLVQGGSYSNNNYGLYIAATFPDSSGNPQAQGGSWFIKDASIDYNIVAQGVFKLAPTGNAYCQNSLHLSNCHIENNPSCIGPGAWFTLEGRASWTDNEVYINGASPSSLVTIGDNSSGSMVNNRIGGGATPLFASTTANAKSVFGYGNECNPVGQTLILLRDATGSTVQALSPATPSSVLYGQDNLLFTVANFGGYRDIFLSSACTKFTLPSNGADSFRTSYSVQIWNNSTAGVTMYVPEGVTLAGLNGSVQSSAGQGTIAAQAIPANSMVVLRKSDPQTWSIVGAFAASAH